MINGANGLVFWDLGFGFWLSSTPLPSFIDTGFAMAGVYYLQLFLFSLVRLFDTYIQHEDLALLLRFSSADHV